MVLCGQKEPVNTCTFNQIIWSWDLKISLKLGKDTKISQLKKTQKQLNNNHNWPKTCSVFVRINSYTIQ